MSTNNELEGTEENQEAGQVGVFLEEKTQEENGYDRSDDPFEQRMSPDYDQVETDICDFAKMTLDAIHQGEISVEEVDVSLHILHATLLKFSSPLVREILPTDWCSLKRFPDPMYHD